MFDFGEVGYHEYRATQGGRSGKNVPGAALGLLVGIIGSVIGLFLVLFIGLFLWNSYN